MNGDIILFQGEGKARRHQVQAGGSGASINAGEPVAKSLGSAYVAAMATNKPVVATDYLVGISASKASSETASADGFVDVIDLVPGQVFLMKPNVAASWDTQAEYNALVGDRVLMDLTGGSYTILATDGATSGCVIELINVVETPGKVAFSIRHGASYLA